MRRTAPRRKGEASPILLTSGEDLYATLGLRWSRVTTARPGGRQRTRGDSFPFCAKETRTNVGSQGAPPKVSILVQRDRVSERVRTDVTGEPTTTSPPPTLQAKTAFRQDKMYLLSPFKFGRCGIPSHHCDKGRGPGPL